MTPSFLYLSRDDVASLNIEPEAARQLIDETFRAYAQGRLQALPKAVLDLSPGHAFQAMCASSTEHKVAGVKWLGITPAIPDVRPSSIDAIICLNDITTGRLLAIMDGDLITLIRTAAMSVAAAKYLAPIEPKTIGFVGCGPQAIAHFYAFIDYFKSIDSVRCISAGGQSAVAMATLAHDLGFAATKHDDAESVVRASDIVITTVPNKTGMQAFLDPAWLKPAAYVAAVDLGRSWHPNRFQYFDILATDSILQWDRPYAADGTPISRQFDVDLGMLASGGEHLAARISRTLFNFRGHAIADLAIADLVYRTALIKGAGNRLNR